MHFLHSSPSLSTAIRHSLKINTSSIQHLRHWLHTKLDKQMKGPYRCNPSMGKRQCHVCQTWHNPATALATFRQQRSGQGLLCIYILMQAIRNGIPQIGCLLCDKKDTAGTNNVSSRRAQRGGCLLYPPCGNGLTVSCQRHVASALAGGRP